MSAQTRTLVTFHSTAFNTTEPKEYFINPGCFGDDLARWLIQRLRLRGIETDSEPGQEDFGWYFNFKLAEGEHCFVLGFRPGEQAEEGDWIGCLERKRGLVGSVLGLRNRDISSAATEAIHSALSNASEIRNAQWHLRADFDLGIENRASEMP